MKKIAEILQSLGLLDSEVKTYMAALQNGASTVLELSKETSLSRQATYVAIDGLVKRGLMSSALQGKKRFYAAEHPDKLLAYAKRKTHELNEQVSDLERLVPDLELKMGGDRPVVRVYEGKEGIKAIIEDMKVTNTKKIVEITDVDAMFKVLSPEDLKSMRLELRRRGAVVEGLYSGVGTDSPTVEANRLVLTDEDSNFQSHIAVDGDKIQLVTFKGKMISVIVDSEALASTMRILFKYALHGSKHLPKR